MNVKGHMFVILNYPVRSEYGSPSSARYDSDITAQQHISGDDLEYGRFIRTDNPIVLLYNDNTMM